MELGGGGGLNPRLFSGRSTVMTLNFLQFRFHKNSLLVYSDKSYEKPFKFDASEKKGKILGTRLRRSLCSFLVDLSVT